MDANASFEPHIEHVWTFTVPNPDPLGQPNLAIDDFVLITYLLCDVNVSIDFFSWSGIIGANSAGKSTLLNLVLDKLTPTKGNISQNPHLHIERFTQHSADKLDLQLSYLKNMLEMFPNDQELRL